jgi:AcrR family transcriptional regulator
MFNTAPATKKSEQTRKHILSTALDLFRTHGFDPVTMRDIAKKSGSALGAAYYYFPAKESLVVAYYQTVQDEHTRRVREAIAAGIATKNGSRPMTLRECMGVAMHSKIDIIFQDRKLLGAPFRYTGIPDHPLSFLGKGTAHIRQQAIEVFREVVSPTAWTGDKPKDSDLPKDLKEALPIALWALHMGLMLYFLYDDSPDAKKTRKLIDNSLDLTETFIGLAKFPLLKPFRGKIMGILREAELVA